MDRDLRNLRDELRVIRIILAEGDSIHRKVIPHFISALDSLDSLRSNVDTSTSLPKLALREQSFLDDFEKLLRTHNPQIKPRDYQLALKVLDRIAKKISLHSQNNKFDITKFLAREAKFILAVCLIIASSSYIYSKHFKHQPVWHAEYFDNQTLAGSAVAVRNEVNLDFLWGNSGPLPNLRDQFSARYFSCLHVAEDNTNLIFHHGSDDGMRFYLDEKLVYESWKSQGFEFASTTVVVDKGEYFFTVEYFEVGGFARLLILLSVNFQRPVQMNDRLFRLPSEREIEARHCMGRTGAQ